MSAEPTILATVSARAEAEPDRLAVADGTRRLAFGDLAREVRRVARALSAEPPTGEPAPVALLVGQDVDAVVGLLGIWQAGRLAVPLDRDQPAAARDELLAHAGCRQALIGDHDQGDLPSDVVTVPIGALAGAGVPEPTPPSAAAVDQPAVVYYTSGTTGRPKGLVISHGAQVLGTRSWCEAYGIGPDDRVALAFHHSFGASRVSQFGALVAGASLHVYDVPRLGLDGFVDAVEDDGITFVHCAPAVLRAVVDQLAADPGRRRRLSALRTLVLGAEGIRPGDVARFRSVFPPTCTLVYSYAVSEAGPITALALDAAAPVDDAPLPVGRPLPGKHVHIAEPDDTGTGEIVVSGVGLADGYWRDPQRTAARFVSEVDPDGSRRATFRTGDLGRLRSDGLLEFRGRSGSLVKLRGYSVDTGLVENAVVVAMQAREAVVVVEELHRPRLVAYVVPGDEPDGRSIPAVRALLAERLPSYMVPAVVVLTDHIPRTTRGKIAPAELPPVPPGRPELSSAFVAPGDDLERSVAAVWERVLDVSPIGVDDDFFSLGGDSLAAAESVAALAADCGVAVPLAAFVEAPTIAGIAAIVRGDRQRWTSAVVPMQAHGHLVPFCCVHGAFGDVLNFIPLAARLGPDRPFYAIQMTPAVGRRSLHRIEALATDHLAQLRQVLPDGSYVLGGFSFGGVVAIEMARQLAAEGAAPPLVVLLDATSPGQARRRRRQLPTLTRLRSALGLQVRAGIWQRLGWKGPLKVDLVAKRSVRRYRPGPYAGPVLFVRGTVPEVRAEDATSVGWDDIVVGQFDVVDVGAEHLLIMEPPAVDEVAARIAAAIDDLVASEVTR